MYLLFIDAVSLGSSSWSGTHYITQAGTEFMVILLSEHPDYWDYRHVPSYSTLETLLTSDKYTLYISI